MLCARAQPAAGQCPEHREEPLLDTASSSVLDLMDAADSRVRSRTYGVWVSVGVIGGLIVGGPVILFSMRVLSGGIAGLLASPKVMGPVITMFLGGGGAVGSMIAKRRFQPRFARWTRGAGLTFDTDRESEMVVKEIAKE